MSLAIPPGPEHLPEPVPDPNRPAGLRATLTRAGSVPPPVQVYQGVVWYATEGAVRLGVVALKLPYLVLLELGPVLGGARRAVRAWVSWVSLAKVTEAETEKKPTPSDLKWQEQRRSGRRWVSGICLVLVTVAVWVAVIRYPLHLAAAGVLVLVLLDLLGHAGRPREKALPPPHRAVLKEGVPLHQVTEEIIVIALREGLELGVLGPLRYDSRRQDYEIQVSCLDEIKPEHCRALERGLGAADHAIRVLAPPDAEAGVRRLVIRRGDPLAQVPMASYLPTGTLSISDPIELGVSMTEVPFALDFAGEHVKLVGTTGSGKSAWALRNMIARVSACRNAACLGIALTKQQELAIWRGVLQRRAYTVLEADRLLDELLAEIAVRGALLTRFAEDDDPTNDHLTEWCDELAARTGRPAWVCFIDEFSVFAAYDGTGANKEEPNLLRKAEQVVRTGRSVWVSLVMASQKVGNNDFGSKVMQDMANTSIGLPCSADDAWRLFGTDRRDAGFSPHLLKPGTKAARNDAGKCFVAAPGLAEPDLYSFYAPLDAGTVKEWARRRVAEGLTSMYPGRPADEGAGEEEAVVVDPLLAEMERVFAGRAVVSSAEVCEALAGTEWEGVSQARLADLLRPHGMVSKGRTMPGGKQLRGYALEDLERALQQSGTIPDTTGAYGPEDRP